ncbi:hypothetical protein HanXRQr2_Chr12g0541641 [Helianthus annuus]|uniref:Uncharacterized protein n=1 Tax=Helianthus annuus TaxID=4232 RepID=A0A251T1Z2_HELAN|nr:uncharacterized protein LOC110894944 [Helianthus annuus]KAF5777937.1 hypothetical protein HanXRQr2_Chr12g0541641 [Helianthus annuus]KAJ0862709.1 hypothetical protein HanPSC8_Chr12g0521461 [Helianthus annuus]
MKEQTDDLLLNVKKSTVTVDSTSTDVKIDDVMVDVVSDVSVDDHGVSRVDLEGSERKTVTHDKVTEDSDDRVVNLEKVEVVVSEEGVKGSVEVVRENVETANGSDCDDQKPGNGSVNGDSKVVFESSSKEVEAGGGDVEVRELVVVVADGDHVVEEKTQKETEVLDSLKIPESTENEDGVDQTNIESLQATVEATTNDAKKSGNGDSKVAVEIQDSRKIPESEDSKMDDENVVENLDQKAEVKQMSKDESSQPTIEVRTDSVSEDSKMDDKSQIFEGEIAVKDIKEDSERSLTKETAEQPTRSVEEVAEGDHVMDVKTVNSSKISHAVTMASLGLEDDDVVVVDEVLEGKKEARDSVSVELSLACPDCQSLSAEVVNAGTCEVDQKVEVDSTIVNDEVAACSKADDVTTTHTEPDSHVQVFTDGGILIENQSMKDNDVVDSSKPDEVAYTEPESSIDKMTPSFANKVVETDMKPATIGGDLNNIQEHQDSAVGVPSTGEPQTYDTHVVLPANTEFSYEEAQMDRGEDAGMDIDEVLAWKDEIPSVQEDEQKADPTNLSHVEKQETESSRIQGIDKSASVNSFEPDKLVDYVRLLATVQYGEGDKTELTMAKAQLSSYDRFKGHRQLAEFQLFGDLLEAEQVIKDETYSEDGSKKRKALDFISDGLEKRPTLHTETVAADHLAGNNVSVQNPGPTQMGNEADMLSQLHLAAQDPMKGHNFVNTIIPLFKGHRAAVLSKSRKRKTSNENESDEFEFVDVNDSYWTDRIIQNHPEEQALQENLNGGGVHQMVAYEQEKPPVKPARRSNKKRFFSSNHELEANEQSELIKRRQQNLATEVLMRFADGSYFPSEIHLNKMFRRFGPLMESETEVDRQSGRARVVFKKCSDAEIAHSSAGTFNIFGSIGVHYELNYTPLISYKPLPLPLTQGQDQPHAR